MNAHTYQQMIVEGIKGLPPERLSEVAGLDYLLRKRAQDPEAFMTSKETCYWRRSSRN